MMMRCTPRRTLAASAMVALYFLADYEYGKSTGAMQQRQELLRAVAPSHPLQPARDPLLQPEPAPPAALAADPACPGSIGVEEGERETRALGAGLRHIIQFNVYDGVWDLTRRHKLCEWLRRQQADVVSLNELNFWGAPSHGP
jgi:hypothetical protein